MNEQGSAKSQAANSGKDKEREEKIRNRKCAKVKPF